MLSNKTKRELKIDQRQILIDSIEIGIPSPQQILTWGERLLPNGKKVGLIKNSKTVNYKRFTPFRDGLFCERIFGPVTSFVCACGKKQSHSKVTFCEKCEVEYIDQRSRRYRLGYISLLSPVTHVWYLKGRPSYLSLFLGKRKKTIVALAYCNAYLIEHVFSKKNEGVKTGPIDQEATSWTKSPSSKVYPLLTPFRGTGDEAFSSQSYMRSPSNTDVFLQARKATFCSEPLRGNKPFFGLNNETTRPIKNKSRASNEYYKIGVTNYKKQSYTSRSEVSKALVFADYTKQYHYLPPTNPDKCKFPYTNDRGNKRLVQPANEVLSQKKTSFNPPQLINGSPLLLPLKVHTYANEQKKTKVNPVGFSTKNLVSPLGTQAKLRDHSFSKNKKDLYFSCGASAYGTYFYVRQQTLPFLPTLVSHFYLRDALLNFIYSLATYEDFPLMEYCAIKRREPLRDVHKFMARKTIDHFQNDLAYGVTRSRKVSRTCFFSPRGTGAKATRFYKQKLEGDKSKTLIFYRAKKRKEEYTSEQLRSYKTNLKPIRSPFFIDGLLNTRNGYADYKKPTPNFTITSSYPFKTTPTNGNVFSRYRHDTLCFRVPVPKKKQPKVFLRKTLFCKQNLGYSFGKKILQTKVRFVSKFFAPPKIMRFIQIDPRTGLDDAPRSLSFACVPKGFSTKNLVLRAKLRLTNFFIKKPLVTNFLLRTPSGKQRFVQATYPITYKSLICNGERGKQRTYLYVSKASFRLQNGPVPTLGVSTGLADACTSTKLRFVRRFVSSATYKKGIVHTNRISVRPNTQKLIESLKKAKPYFIESDKLSKTSFETKAKSTDTTTHLSSNESKVALPEESNRSAFSGVELTAIREILSYTGGGALQQLLQQFNQQELCKFLFAEAQILRVLYETQSGTKITKDNQESFSYKYKFFAPPKMRFSSTYKFFAPNPFGETKICNTPHTFDEGDGLQSGPVSLSFAPNPFGEKKQVSTGLALYKRGIEAHHPRFGSLLSPSKANPLAIQSKSKKYKASYKSKIGLFLLNKSIPKFCLRAQRAHQVFRRKTFKKRTNLRTSTLHFDPLCGKQRTSISLALQPKGFSTKNLVSPLGTRAKLRGTRPICNQRGCFSYAKATKGLTKGLIKFFAPNPFGKTKICKKRIIFDLYKIFPHKKKSKARNQEKLVKVFGVREYETSLTTYKRFLTLNSGTLTKYFRSHSYCLNWNTSQNKLYSLQKPGGKFPQFSTNLSLATLIQNKRSDLKKKQRLRIARRIYKVARRLKIASLLTRNHRKPEWMILSHLPVLPPDLRPILQMSEKVIVASDLNIMYQRVIYRNNRHLRVKFIDFHLVTAIQRLVQDAVDRLIENGKGGTKPYYTQGGRPLKSLSDILKGKKGRFRLNLLGKRVDFSGRSVIVVSPLCQIHECGLPKEIALELYHYFLLRQLIVKKYCASIVTAKKMIKSKSSRMWEILRVLMYHHPVLLNRAPTLHRLGIQAFQPKLVLGNAIALHPLVCSGFNADFDGDQMGVHLPLSFAARAESWDLLWSRNNLLSPATGQPMLVPSQDMVLGFYYITAQAFTTDKYKHVACTKSRDIFLNLNEITRSLQRGKIKLHTPVWLYWRGKIENEEGSQRPLELRIHGFGIHQSVYEKYIWSNVFTKTRVKIDKMEKNHSLKLCIKPKAYYVRTTAGRVLMNALIKSKKNNSGIQS